MQAKPLPARKPKDAAQKVADALALAIHEHCLVRATKPGEDEPGEIYKVSRTVVRAVFQSLGHTQLVEIQRKKGAFVASPTRREPREVFEARALQKPRAARSAASRATPRDIDSLKDHITQEHLDLDAGDSGRALNLSGRFHIEIARISSGGRSIVFQSECEFRRVVCAGYADVTARSA